MTHKIELPDIPEYAPEPPPHGPKVWLQKNLFSTPASSVLSVVFIIIAIAGLRGMLGFIFAEARRWEAVTYNVRLLMVRAYPADQLNRVWLSIAVAAILIAATSALYQTTGRTSPRPLRRHQSPPPPNASYLPRLITYCRPKTSYAFEAATFSIPIRVG